MSRKYLMRVIHTYTAIEDILISMQPKSRHNNDYARRFLRSFFKHNLDSIPAKKSAVVSKLEDMGSDRYYTMNLTSLRSHKTIENRLHSASYQADKILNWVQLLRLIYNYALASYDRQEVETWLKTDVSQDKIETVMKAIGASPELIGFYLKRSRRFTYERLAQAQKSFIELRDLKPKLDKLQRDYETASARYSDARDTAHSLERVMAQV
jgi:hypothetical protein